VALCNGLGKLGHGTSISLYFLACIFSQIFAWDSHFLLFVGLHIFAYLLQITLQIFANICKYLQIFENLHSKYAQICKNLLQITLQIFAKICTRFAKICNTICENMHAICKNLQRDLRKYATRFAKICNAICENLREYATRKMPNLRKSAQYREKFTRKSAKICAMPESAQNN